LSVLLNKEEEKTMNIRMPRKWLISAVVTVGLVLTVWAVGSVLAQGPDEPQTTPPAPPTPPDQPSERVLRPEGPEGGGANETHAFTYQGVLEMDGQPATGFYDFYVTLWADSGLTLLIGECDDPTDGNFPNGYVDNVSVEDGVFTLYLVCNGWSPRAFNGSSRWLDFWVVESSSVIWEHLSPPQPVSPVPTAFSLFPGASIRGGVTSPSAAISVTQTFDSVLDDAFAVYGYAPSIGIYGAAIQTGVMGHSYGHEGNRAGVFGESVVGVGVRGVSSAYHGVYGETSTTDIQFGYGGFFVNTGGGYLIAANNSNTASDLEFKVSFSGVAYADGGWQGAADFAELMTTEDLPAAYEPGDVLVISTEEDRSVALSSDAYSTLVIGVYSENPGFVGSPHAMEERRDDEIPVAVVGIVDCKVSAENGSIQRGDLLVASSTPGHAMRAGDDPPVGTLIGKALEGLEEGTGLIQILVTLQ
jgi:hypothetical protein